MAAGNLGDLYLEQGDLSEARRWYARTESLAQAHDLAGERVELARRLATLAVREKDPVALHLAQIGLEQAEAAESRVEASRCRALAAVCLARQGDIESTE